MFALWNWAHWHLMHIFTIVISSWWIIPFINMKWLCHFWLILIWNLLFRIWVQLLLLAFSLHLLRIAFSILSL
jgi:hypothetical protein